MLSLCLREFTLSAPISSQSPKTYTSGKLKIQICDPARVKLAKLSWILTDKFPDCVSHTEWKRHSDISSYLWHISRKTRVLLTCCPFHWNKRRATRLQCFYLLDWCDCSDFKPNGFMWSAKTGERKLPHGWIGLFAVRIDRSIQIDGSLHY